MVAASQMLQELVSLDIAGRKKMKELNFLDTFQKSGGVQGPEAFPESRTD